MAAVKLERARCAVTQSDGLTVAALLTLGLSNPTAAGVSAPAIPDAGTINMIVLIDSNLTRSAPLRYAGTATTVGWLIGRAVRGAVLECLQTQ